MGLKGEFCGPNFYPPIFFSEFFISKSRRKRSGKRAEEKGNHFSAFTFFEKSNFGIAN